MKEWIATSDTTGKAHPNQPGNIGTVTMETLSASTTVLITYTAAQSNGDFKLMRISSRPVTSILMSQG